MRWSLAAVLAALLLACGTGPQQDDGDLTARLRAEMERRRIPGLALGVVRDGERVRAEALGVAVVEHRVPVTPDTVFELASLTKQFPATAVVLLAEQGPIDVNAARADALDFAPGERFQYSDVDYFLLGLILERVSGQRYAELLRDRIFQPLGMRATRVIDQ